MGLGHRLNSNKYWMLDATPSSESHLPQVCVSSNSADP